MTRTLEEVYDALTDCGIQLGDRNKRDKLARKLTQEGATAETIELVDRHCRRTYREEFSKRTGAMKKILDGPWQDQIGDFKRYEDKEQQRATKPKAKKKTKTEPGLGERTMNQQSQEQLTAEWHGMTVPELRRFKYRKICAEWFHNDLSEEEVCAPQPKGMGCTPEELKEWAAEFPKDRTFDDAIGIYSGKISVAEVEAREAEETERIKKARAEFREKMKREKQNRKRSEDTSKRPWTRNEYSETSDALRDIKEKFDARPS